MPTHGSRSTLETTQAVGALLLHQFARDRFLQAGLTEDLITEAEQREHVDELMTQILDCAGGDASNQVLNGSSFQNPNNSTDVVHNNTTITELSQISNTATRNSTITNHIDSTINSALNGTLTSDQQEQTYHSFQEQSLNGTNMTSASQGQEKSLYHSVVNSSTNNDSVNQNNVSTNSNWTFDRSQTLPNVSLYGSELRRIAEEFERSSLREFVRNRANQVNLADITKESFIILLKELFQEEITREKIVVLFFFCTDVALRAAEFAQELVIKLMGWSFSYIINVVCSFVHNLGGWDRVLFYQLPSFFITCCTGLAICALLVFLRNSLRS